MANEALTKQQDFVVRARAEGYSDDEVRTWVAEKSELARAEGYSDAEINEYLGRRDFNPKPVVELGERARRGLAIRLTEDDRRQMARREGYSDAEINEYLRPVRNLKDALKYGWGMGTTSLAAEAILGGAMTDKLIDEDTPWYLRNVANIATMVNDAPGMYLGGRVLGGGLPGMFAIPAGLRSVFIDA